MSSDVNSVSNVIKVALGVCAVCSIIISSAAVVLKPMQTTNMLLDRNKNILMAAGLFDPAQHTNADVEQMFAEFTPRLVNLDEGRFVEPEDAERLGLDAATYDQATVQNDPELSISLSSAEDQASIRRRVNYATVYTLDNDAGDYEIIVLPVSGYGLWGIMYGYLALESDGNTIRGLGFYDHGETPGLGGEISNPRWLAQWPGKRVYGDGGDIAFRVVKGGGSGEHQVDGLAGATLTSNGVENMIGFWMGDMGFGSFLQNEIQGD